MKKSQLFKILFLSVGIVLLTIGSVIFKSDKVDENINNDYPVWIDMMEESNVNLEEARKAFDEYWKYNTHYKGDNSKKFERWYTRNSKRLDLHGNVISASQVKSEFQRMRRNASVPQHGKWINYGPITVGPRNGIKKDGGRVKDVSFHPTDPDTYFVSCFKSGLFKTIDSGETWVSLTDQLAEEVYISKVLPSTPNTIFIGTDSGLMKSTDGGITWGTTGLTTGKANALLIKSDNEDIILVGTGDGIYRSTNRGQTFTQVKAASKVEELRIHPTNANIMYAGTNGAPSQFFRSTDAGCTWTENTTDFGQGAFMKIAVTPADANYVYVINSRDHLGNDSFDGVYRSTDAGVTFTKQSGTLPCITGYKDDGAISRGQPNYNLFIVSDPVDKNIVYAGGVKSWKSIDGGVTWIQVFNNITADNGSLHLDQLTWSYSPINNKLFAVNDGGIYFLNTDNKFESITDGLPIAEVWECTQSQINKTNVAGGTFHCGIKLNKNGTWYSPWGGDESTCIFDYTDDTYAYHVKYEKISRSIDGGFSFQRINSSTADRGEYTGTVVLDKSNVNTLFVGLFEVERTQNAREPINANVAWTKISSFGGTSKIVKIEQSDADHNTLYVSRKGNTFYRSDNVREATPIFTDLTANLPISGTVTDIATHPTDPDLVYVLLGSKIYKSSNKGVSWTDISNGLPNIALLEMIYDKSSDEGIYIGTDIGVYYKDATLADWIDYSNGLPVIRISGMDIYYGNSREESILTVATDGRGFWRSALNDVVIPVPTANFTSDKQTVINGNTVSFEDASTGQPLVWNWKFEGGTPETSNEKNPRVTYNTIGTYKVTLTTSNTSGEDTKEIVDYITVTVNTGTGTLQGHYNFDDNINDTSSYQRDLVTVGGFIPKFIEDRDNNSLKAYDSPGVSGKYLSNGYKGIGGTGARTVTAWIKTDATSNSRKTIVSWGTNASGKMWNVMVEKANIRVEAGASNLQNDNTGVTPLNNNTWRHIAVTLDPNDASGTNGELLLKDVKLYIDGQLVANAPDSGASFNSETRIIDTDIATATIQIGNVSYAPSYFWRGALDDLRIYSEALSAEDIQDIYLGQEANLVLTPNESFFSPVGTLRAHLLDKNTGNEFNKFENYDYIYDWKEQNDTIIYGLNVTSAGSLTITPKMGVPENQNGSELYIYVDGIQKEISLNSTGAEDIYGIQNSVVFENICEGFHEIKLQLKSLSTPDSSVGRLENVLLGGTAGVETFMRRYRPFAIHGKWETKNTSPVEISVHEITVLNTKVNSYQPITTPFGYTGSPWSLKTETFSGYNFSLWSYGKNDPVPPFYQESHLIAVGPGLVFGSYGHEGTGVKPRGPHPYVDVDTNVQTIAVRMVPGEVYDTYWSYYLDPITGHWKLYGCGKKYNDTGEIEYLKTGAFLEVAGGAHKERSGHQTRKNLYRGWQMDTSGNWHPIHKLVGSTKVNTISYRDWASEDNKFSMSMGGWGETGTPKETITLSDPDPVPDYLQGDFLDELYRMPASFIDTAPIEITTNSAKLSFEVADLGTNAIAQVFWGTTEGLTKEERWTNKLSIPVNNGSNTFTINDLIGNTDYFYRIKIQNDQGITWSFDTQKFKTLTSVTIPVVSFTANKVTITEGESINFTDTSTNTPISWEWSFEGGTPSSSTAQNPTVTYSTAGTFQVTLTATNNEGAGTKTIVDYITVTSSDTGTLQGHYNFQGNLNDDSTYLRNLTKVGSFTLEYGNDKENNPTSAYQAPSLTGNYVTSSYKGIGTNNERTVTAWIKTTEVGSRKTIVSWGTNKQGQMFNIMVDTGRIRVEAGSSNVQSTQNGIEDDLWHHIAVTYNPIDGDKLKDVKIYIDGVLSTNEPDSGASHRSEIVVINTDNTINTTRIGSASYNSNYFWQGSLDDIRIYSEALSANDITNIYSENTNSFLEETELGNKKAMVFPNPFLEDLTIKTSMKGKIDSIIYDVTGNAVVMKSYENEKGKLEVSLKDLPSGLYFITLVSDIGEHLSLKMVKK